MINLSTQTSTQDVVTPNISHKSALSEVLQEVSERATRKCY